MNSGAPNHDETQTSHQRQAEQHLQIDTDIDLVAEACYRRVSTLATARVEIPGTTTRSHSRQASAEVADSA